MVGASFPPTIEAIEGWSKDGEELLFASHEPAASMQKGQANSDNGWRFGRTLSCRYWT
jgi:hypothetical protein